MESVADSRILDRSAGFRQSRGRWSVHRLSRQRPGTLRRRCRCFQWCCLQTPRWSEWNLGGWFHRLAYQRTGILIIILFSVYFCIVLFFAIVYLGVSIMGQTTEENPDGSEKIIPFCHMEIDNKMSALYLSLSTMAAIGYGGKSETSLENGLLALGFFAENDLSHICRLLVSFQLLLW